MKASVAKLKKRLKEKKQTLGSWISIGHPCIVDIMATAPIEWLVIDLEHSAMSLETAQIMITTIQSHQITALVRVSENEPTIIKRVMDMGADGVIVPMVNSKEEAIRAVESVYYPPLGKRGVGLYRAQNYGIGFDEYKADMADQNAIIIAQIEHIDAVNNIDEILSVDTIDAGIIGPYDLSGSMGYPGEYDRDDVKEALQIVKDAYQSANKSIGFHVISSTADKLKERADEGYNFLAFSLDFFFLGDRLREEMEKLSGNSSA